MARILVTGAAGFVGSHLTDRLLAEGHQVIGVDSYITGAARNLDHLRDDARFTFIEHDVIQPLRLDTNLDWVMHFASPASPPKYRTHWLQTLRVNSEGTFHLLELAKRTGASFFLASTSEVYGDPDVHPQPETYWGHVHSIGERSMYDEGKRFAEALTSSYVRSEGLDARIIRIFNTFGPRMDKEDGRAVTNFINQAIRDQPLTIYGDGEQTRSFQYIDDLIEGIIRLMRVDYRLPVNLGNPHEYSMLEFAALIRELAESQSPLVYAPIPSDDPRQRRPDISLARRLLDWEPRVPVRDGLKETIEYFRRALHAVKA